ncbi:MAG: recombinase [[Eubacterium] sulci]|nr:recombinase [[Eubacterium] sulci]
MYKNRIIQTVILVGAVLSIIAIFLPIYEMSYPALSIVDAVSIYDDYRSRDNELLALIFMLAPASATLAIILKKKIPVIILGAIQCILWVIVGLIEESLIKSINLTSNIQITYGIAFYLGLVGAVLIILGGITAVATEAFVESDEDSTIDNDF